MSSKCGVCFYEEMTLDVAKKMRCGHFVCLDCYFKLTNNKCPYCRGEIKHALFKESSLFKKYFLREISDLIKNTQDTTLGVLGDPLLFIINFEDETIEDDFVYEIDKLYKSLRDKVYENILSDKTFTDLFHF